LNHRHSEEPSHAHIEWETACAGIVMGTTAQENRRCPPGHPWASRWTYGGLMVRLEDLTTGTRVTRSGLATDESAQWIGDHLLALALGNLRED
jgi:hypothetical protein